MADTVKGVVKLEVTGDGRTAGNWAAYKMQVQNILAHKERNGLYLDDVLLNRGVGKEVSMDTEQPPEAFAKWERANRVVHGHVMATLPAVLLSECTQRPKAHVLWAYLTERFAGTSLVSACGLWARLFQVRLANFAGVSAFLTELTKHEQALQENGEKLSPTLLPGAIIMGIGDAYPTTRELLMTLPRKQQTKDVFATRLLEAEKNSALSAEMSAFSVNVVAANSIYNKGGGARQGCGYVRKHQGRSRTAIPGQQCLKGAHKRQDCWMYLDDEWLQAYPTKTGADLPNPLQALYAQKARFAPPPASKASVPSGLVAEANVAVNLIESTVDVFGQTFLGYTPLPQTAEASIAAAPALTVVLDSGASTSCFKEGANYKALPHPINVRGAGAGMSLAVQGTTAITCPALRGGELRGLHSRDFRHNLASVQDLQRQGVEIVFPAHQAHAECRNPGTGEVTWHFHLGKGGLYEAHCDKQAMLATCECGGEAKLHPTELLHRRLGHLGETSLRRLIHHQAMDGLPSTYNAPPQTLSSCLPCIQGKTQAQPHPSVRSRAAARLDKVHVDLVGPLPTSIRGERYCLTIVDDNSRFGWSVLLRTKGQACCD